MQYIKYIIIGIVIFLILTVINKLSFKFFKQKKNRNKFQKSFIIIEFLTWTVFLLWSVKALFQEKFYFTILMSGIIIISLIFIGYYIIRDFIAGLLLKTEYNIHENSKIQIDKINGKVLKLKYLSLELENTEHEKIRIPYNKISGKEIVILNAVETVKKYACDIEIAKDETNIIDAKLKLKQKILNSAWASITKKPDIKLKSENKNSWIFTIYYFAQTENHSERIKTNLYNL